MNILFLINYAGKAGTEKYVDNLQQIFTEEGHCCFFAYNLPGKLSDTMRERGVPSLQLGLTRKDISKSSRILADYCRENKIDVIHAQFPVENIIGIRSLKYYSTPKVVFTSHLSDVQGLKWKILNRINTPKNHCVICVCDEGRENLIKSGISADKLKVIYNGIESSAIMADHHGSDIFKLVTVARYAPEKGLDFLLEVLKELKLKTNKKFNCSIIGDGEEFDYISDKAKKMGLDDVLIQLGFRTDSADILINYDLYLNTSRSGEAMSFAILEAMNAGLPLVVTNVGGNAMLAEKNIVCGKVVEYGDIKGYVDAILEYINNNDLLTFHSMESKRKVVEEFDLRRLALKVLEAYK